MGEYATLLTGDRIKIGTCESLTNLRADQVDLLVPSDRRRVIDVATQGGYRFRFPYPHEDGRSPGSGSFDWDFKLSLYGEHLIPSGMEHYNVQFASTHPKGLLLSVACPFSAEGAALGLNFGKNGWSGDVQVVSQKVVGDRLVLCVGCAACQGLVRLEDFEDVQPIIAALREAAKSKYQEHLKLDVVADRIAAGYELPLPF